MNNPGSGRPNRAFADVPRSLVTGAAVVGGLIGMWLAYQFNWSMLTAFGATLGIAFGCVLVAVFGYRAVMGGPKGSGK